MLPITLPPATAAVRAQARAQCRLPYRAASAQDPSLLRASFTDVLAGSATIAVYIDAHGKPIAADVMRLSDESFEPAALQLLAAWHYRPATCGRRAVDGSYTAIFNG